MEVTENSSAEIFKNRPRNNPYNYYLLYLPSNLCCYINILIAGSLPLITTLYSSTARLSITFNNYCDLSNLKLSIPEIRHKLLFNPSVCSFISTCLKLLGHINYIINYSDINCIKKLYNGYSNAKIRCANTQQRFSFA